MTRSSGGGMGSEAQQRVVDRAVRDPDFRTRLLENPQEAIQEELGIPISSATTIRVVEEQPGELVLVLPPRPMEAGAMISDEELEQVAGGITEVKDTCFVF